MTIARKEVEAFMKSAGVASEKASLDTFFKVMDGKDVPTLVKDGEKRKVSMPSGGGGGAAAAPGAKAAAPVVEEKKEEAEAVDMGGLFGDEDDY
tara:strand:+ start:282 stop:563 length:282 start_codon:yes stop_codon:yes gene_type:complete